MAALADNPQTPVSPSKNRRLRLWLFILVGVVLLAAASAFGWRMYVQMREQRIVQKARDFMEQKDYGQALIAAQWALQVSPRNLAAHRIMADLADLGGASQAVFWHRAVAELDPSTFENHQRCVDSALRFNDLPMAQQALAAVPDASRQTAAYHELAARVAQATSGKSADAIEHFTEAIRLDPANERLRFGLAAVRLESTDAATRAEARRVIEEFSQKPDRRQGAYRLLIQDHFRRSEWKEGFLLAADLQAIPDAPFEDRLLLLDLMRRFNRPELHAYLMDVQTSVSGDPERAASLIKWLNRNTMAMIAADWARSLPADTSNKYPVPSAIAESYANLKDWKRLRPLATEGDWREDNFMRLALLARVMKEEGDEIGSHREWTLAVQAAANRPDALERLARFAEASLWRTEKTDLLWKVARGAVNQGWALAILRREYFLEGNSRGCLNVATRSLELRPEDPGMQNEVASYSLLLETNMERALVLSRTAHTKEPGNPIYAATYAFALHQHGRTEEGLKLMRPIDEKLLQRPAFAAYMGVLLADGGTAAEALKYLEIAKTGNLLPEERKLTAAAWDRAQRRSAETARP